MKGSYKAKLSLEKLIIEFERKKNQVQVLRAKQENLQRELTELQEVAGEVKYAAEVAEDQTKKSDPSKQKAHHEYLVKEMLWMQEDFDRERKKK